MHYIYFFIIDTWGENANSDNETKILNEKGTCNFIIIMMIIHNL